jgi:alpha-L-rhamnosidase
MPAAVAVADPEPPLKIDARWIWYPERRTLPGTFVFFRKSFRLDRVPPRVEAWVTASTRYMLWVNGAFLGRGPAPCDPRYWDVDPVDLAPHLQVGENVVCAIAAFYGGGDGTVVPSAPLGSGGGAGFLFQARGDGLEILSDATWRCARPRCWKPGNYQRWFLRCLQEEFDARLFPEGWLEASFVDAHWRTPVVSRIPAGRPMLAELSPEGWRDDWVLRPRAIPRLRETRVLPESLGAAGWVDFTVSPEEYFECAPSDAFTETPDARVIPERGSSLFPLTLAAPQRRAVALTFEFGRELVGHPFVEFRAPAGTIIEMLFVEKQEDEKLLLRTNPRYGHWLRVVARDAVTRFEAFEFDAVRHLQLLVRNSTRPVEILAAGVIERNYPWPRECDLKTSDAALNTALAASVNTHKLLCQETIVDNVARERQQYAGDLDHSKLGSCYAFGEFRQPARVIRTFAQGQSDDGWFMDCWPAWDRTQRLWQKHLGLTRWGAIIDHALQFGIAVAWHHLFTGDRELIAEIYPRLLRFDQFLQRNVRSDGLLPVAPWTWNCVWIDHIGYQAEEDKHCALNLYWAGFLTEGLARLAAWLGDSAAANEARARAAALIDRCRARYWHAERELFIDNLPRVARDGALRAHSRTLSMAYLFHAIPAGSESRSIDLLAAIPTSSNRDVFPFENNHLQLGFDYPLNAIWRFWALGRAGRAQTILADLKERWARLPSVLQNNTYAEFWNPGPSSTGQVWCQNNPVPLLAVYMEILGLRPLAAGFSEYELRPQPAGLGSIEATVHTPRGPIQAHVEGFARGFTVRWTSPPRTLASLTVPGGARLQGLPPGLRPEPGLYPATRRIAMPVSSSGEQSWTINVSTP